VTLRDSILGKYSTFASVVGVVVQVQNVLLVLLVLALSHHAYLQQLVDHFIGVVFRFRVVNQHVHEV